MKLTASLLAAAALSLVALPVLGACSGGGGDGPAIVLPPPPPPPPPAGQEPTWTQGSFQAASVFKDQCAAPRSGTDIEGNTFPDQQGSLLKEKFWLRSWTNETYLWNTEVTDTDPAATADRIDYFNQLRTTAKTASGEDKDDFHFNQPTDEFLEARNSAPRSGYGVSLIVSSNTVPRDFRIRYTEPNSPASAVVNGQANFIRGARILTVDGVDLINGGSTQAELDTLNDGLFPALAGESHTFTVQDAGSSTPRTVTLVSQDIAAKPVNRLSVISTSTGKVGYILFNTFSPFASEKEIADAMTTMKAQGVNDLIVDLRYNGGGLLAVASQLGYMIAGNSRTSGKTFELLQFNAAAGNVNPVTGEVNQPIPFYDTGLGFSVTNGASLTSLNLPRVFILSTSRTCSASEAVINGLRGADVEIILIGDTTCGKPFGFFPTDNCGETFFTIQFRGVNDKNFGDYSDGFVPMNSNFVFGVKVAGCVVPDDLNHELGDVNEALLSAALQYRIDGTCPAVSSSKISSRIRYLSADMPDVATTGLTPAGNVLETNRDMRMPN